MATVRRKLIGHYNYYGITDNAYSMSKYYYAVIHLLLKWLNRRSQRRSYQTKEEFTKMIKSFDLPMPKIKVDVYAI